MKLTAILLFATCLQVSAKGYAQSVTLSEKNATLEKVFRKIKNQSGYTFVYRDEWLKKAGKVDIDLQNAPIEQALEACFKNQPLTYTLVKTTVVVRLKPTVGIQPTVTNENPLPPPIEIKGKITDDKGQPLEGATILVKGTNNGTKSGANGNFSINAEPNSVLVISYVSFETTEVKIGNQAFISVQMKPSFLTGEEIVVVGYGTSRKKDITGSVASVQMRDQEKTSVIGMEQLLEGQVSGVQVSQNQSQPGALFAVRIRGTNSINASSSPLYVIDRYAGGDAGYLNPTDILSIDVLKDASATAIYGSRGANGVIIITTKRGSKTAPKVTIDAYTGVQQVANKYKMMDAKQFGTYLNTVKTERNLLNGTSDPLPYTQQQIDALGKGTDWQNEIFRGPAPISNYSIAFNGGNADEKHYLGLTFFNQQGIIKGSDFKRATLRYNLDLNLSNKLKVGISSQLGYSHQNRSAVNTSGGADQPSVLWDAIRFNPILAPKDSSGAYTYVNSPAGAVLPLGNPVAYINKAKDASSNLSIFTNLFGEYEIIKGLKIRSSIGANYAINSGELFLPTDLFYAPGVGRAFQSTTRSYNWLNENTLTYDRELNKIHAFNITGGYTFQHWYYKSFNAGITNLSTNILGSDNFGVGIASPPGSYYEENTLASYFTRINYRLMDKYLFTVTMRADGSSRFGANNKWGYFPSGAFAWHLSQENFILKVKAISDMKLRASYGITGNQEIGSYNSLSQYASTSYSLGNTPALVVGLIPINIGNPSLKWESTSSYDVGLDLGLWNNRVYFTTDFYYKKTSNLLLFINIPLTSGYTSILQNIGAVSNKGFEFSATTLNIDQKKIKWSTTLNFSTNANKVLNLGSNPQIYVGGLSNSLFNGANVPSAILMPGKPIGSFYGYVFDGIWQSQEQINKSGTRQAVAPGDPIYKDLNNDSTLNGDDRKIIGQALPKFIFGMTNNFTFGKFNLNVFLQGIYGNKIFNENLYEIQNGSPGFNKLAYVATDSWHGAGTSNTLPRVSSILRNSVGATSDVLEDGSFLRVKTVTLSYDLPVAKHSTVFKSANVYITAQNLLTITNYSGYDPEVNSFTQSNALSLGTDYNAYPNYRTFLVGVKFGF